ncbi:MAG: class I SAM-dependent methyltransferase [Gemmatimonadaceae bacterium]
MDRRSHWERLYRTTGPDQLSWFQAEARLSRQLIERALPDREGRLVDVGAGASTLIDGLLAAGYRAVTVVDVSSRALELAQQRLGPVAGTVHWEHADVLMHAFPPASFDFWHDRAVFHFLTSADERARYVAQVRGAVRVGGLVLVATFAEDGPTRCSGLDVARYSPAQLHGEFGPEFRLLESHRELHTTPAGREQAFTYCLCRFEPAAGSREAA